jgi:hypothetical protein
MEENKLTKDFMTNLIKGVIALWGVVYLCVAISVGEYNIFDWEEVTRSTYVVTMLIITLTGLPLVIFVRQEKE